MTTLRRIGPVSAGRVGFWMGVLLNLTLLIIALVFLAAFGVIDQVGFGRDFWIGVLRSTLVSGITTAITWGTAAYLYNLSARFGGGLQFEFEMDSPSSDEKRKNDPTDVDIV